MRLARALSGLSIVIAMGCGGGPRHASDVRGELAASGLEEARGSAPDLVAAALGAADEAERAEAAGDLEAAADHATRARLLAEAALAERERAAAEASRLEIEQRAIALDEQALRDESAARELEARSAHLAAARIAREELAAALARAEHDEAHPLRRRRVSIGEDAKVRRAAAAIRERARLLAAAATAMDGDPAALARVEELSARSTRAGASLEALELAEQSHETARTLLASARARRPAPSAAEVASAVESISEARLDAMQLERGLAIELSDVFRAGSAQPSAGASAKIARLAAVLATLPHGPLVIEVEPSGTGEAAARVSRQRAEWARTALAEAGVPAERLTIRSEAGAPVAGDRLRVLLVAYVAR